jgi:hypothetical protein
MTDATGTTQAPSSPEASWESDAAFAPDPPDPAESVHAGLGRRSLLTATGVSAGLVALSGILPGRAQAATAAVPGTADLPLIGGATFPIGAFWPPPPTQITLERYQEIADAGFTFFINGNYLWDATGIAYALRIAQQAGLKMLVAGDPLEVAVAGNFWAQGDPTGNRPQLSPEDAAVCLRAVISAYQSSTSFAGLALVDEPAANRFGTLASLVDTVRQVAPTVLPYVNFRRLGQPYGAWGTAGMDAATYAAYVQQAVDTVRPSLLCYDRYPLNANGSDDPDYFQNWAVMRAAGLRANLPVWIYIQSVQYGGHRLPTPQELAWQVNISLAYGAKGIQYFTYWTPDPSRGTSFVPAQGLITVAGERTPLYDAAKQLNTGWVQPVGGLLKPLVSESVVHANDTPLPAGATDFTADDHLAAVTGDALVLGRFAGPGGTDPTRWLLAVNRSHAATATATLRFRADTLSGIARFDPASGSYLPEQNPAAVRLDLDPGAAVLFRLTAR